MGKALRVQPLRGAAIRSELPALASLRLQVFRDWPYLYEGTLDYERRYLDTYAQCAESLAVLVWDGDDCVAATTALPMRAAEAAMREPFEQRGEAVDELLYFGESVVLPSHRGRGLGVAFFEQREAHARALGLVRCAFCAVERPEEHPLKPAHYAGNEGFWGRRGYTPTELRCHFDWQDIGEAAPSRHTLRYWQRRLP